MAISFLRPDKEGGKGAQNNAIMGAHSHVIRLARTRLIWVGMVLMLGYLAITLRLLDLTLLRHVTNPPKGGQTEEIKTLGKPLRGAILDRNGEIIATSLKMASVFADATLIDAPEALAKQVVRVLPDQSYAELVQKFKSGKRFIWIQRDVTPKQQYAINALGSPALGFQEEDRRIYPSANLTAHISGYTDVDGSGIAGIEKSFNKQLTKGLDPVHLTVDLRIQHILHRELAAAVEKFHAKAGIGMVMDANTGEIISMVSLPDFDPHYPSDAGDNRKFNRATLGVYEMGSTFKLFSTAAALDSGLVQFGTRFDAATPIHVGRFTISDFHSKNRMMSVPEIFMYSSNIGTAKMAASIGTEKLKAFYKGLGFMSLAPLEIPERGAPLYPKPWSEVSTLTTSFGHGISVSPLHIVRAAAALVNGGILPQPTLIQREKRASKPTGAKVTSAETSLKMRQLLELVVADGTGSNAYVEGYNVGGKTGTAEKNINGRYIHNSLFSSFIGVYPVRQPRYIVLAIIDEPQPIKETHGYATGGWTAAPVVAHVIEQMGPLYQIAPDLELGKKDIEKDMKQYLKDYKEGKAVVTLGNDH